MTYNSNGHPPPLPATHTHLERLYYDRGSNPTVSPPPRLNLSHPVPGVQGGVGWGGVEVSPGVLCCAVQIKEQGLCASVNVVALIAMLDTLPIT